MQINFGLLYARKHLESFLSRRKTVHPYNQIKKLLFYVTIDVGEISLFMITLQILIAHFYPGKILS